jgi:hypothetical protein
MSQGSVRVLLLGESERGFSFLRGQLERRGCRCWFARSTEETVAVLDQHSFQLIFGKVPPHEVDSILVRMGDSLRGVFCCHLVEDGCWWLPVVRHGQKCFGAYTCGIQETMMEILAEGLL